MIRSSGKERHGRLLKKEPARGEKDAPCMIVFCSFQQIPLVIAEAEKHGFAHYIPLVMVKPTSPQVLKANMKVVGATEYALVLYRDKLPKFRNTDAEGKRHMVFHAYPYNSTDTEKTVDGVTLAPRQKAKFRNAYVAPYRIDYSKDNGAGKGVFTTGDFNANE